MMMTSTNSTSKGRYLPRDRKKREQLGLSLPALQLTERDIRLLFDLAKYGMMTSEQIEALLFTPLTFTKLTQGSKALEKPIKSQCWSRLQKLYHHGLIDRRERPSILSEGRKSYLYFLDEKGLWFLLNKELVDEAEIELVKNRDPLRPLLEHTLTINTIRVGVELACRAFGWKLVQWIDETTLKHQGAPSVTFKGERGRMMHEKVIPDAVFIIDNGSPQPLHFLLEVDRGTETIAYTKEGRRDFKYKLLSYGAYFSGTREKPSLYQQQYGTHKGRVLTITTGPRRAEHMKRLCDELEFERRYWFTSLKEIATPEILFTGPIWRVASLDGLYSIFQ